MRIALIGIGKIANYQMQSITHTRGIKLVDAHDLDPVRAEELPGNVHFHEDLDHAREYGRMRLQGQDELVFDLGTDKPRLVNHYCGVFANLAEMYARKEDNKELSEVLHRLLFAALH